MADFTWFQSYDPGVPRTLEPYPKLTLLDVFEDAVKQRPSYTFLIFKENRITYDQMDRLSDSMAAGLAANGITKGSTVAVVLPNCPQSLISQFGIWKAGGIPVFLNPLYTEEELIDGLEQCGAEVAVIYGPLYRMMQSFKRKHTRLRLLIVVAVQDYASWTARMMYELFQAGPDGRNAQPRENDIRMKDLLKAYAGKPRPDVRIEPEDVALLLQSGGTTGTPRGIMLTHKALIAEAMQVRAWTKPLLNEWDDVFMLNLPLFHVYGSAGVTATAILGHNPLVLIPDPRDHADVIKTMKKTEPAFFAAVPTLFTGLANHCILKDNRMNFKFLKLCISGAAPLMPGTAKIWQELTGHRIYQGYGLTETSAAITIEPVGNPSKDGSVGLPLPDVIIKVVDIETGKWDQPVGQTGEIAVRCPQVMAGFWNSLEETAEMLRGGWLYTGDIGHMDEKGYLFVTSRKKQLIKVSGFQVWPQEVVAVLKTHFMVEDACVAGIPDEIQGESVKAWIVLKKGSEMSAEAVQAYCRQKLTAYKVPRYVEFREALPRSTYGEDMCRKLVAEEKEKTHLLPGVPAVH